MPTYKIVYRMIKVLMNGKRGRICPTGIIDPFIDELLMMESQCENYKSLPFEGGVGDQPKWMMNAFAVIRSTRNMYDEDKMKKAQAKHAN